MNFKQSNMDNSKKGFTLIELLMIFAIIGLLSSVMLASVSSARLKARDAHRLSTMMELKMALDIYFDTYHTYLNTSTVTSCTDNGNNWNTDGTTDAPFGGILEPLVPLNLLGDGTLDPSIRGDCGNYAYYRFPAGSYECDASQGAFYVLGIRLMESIPTAISPNSPGFSCPKRNFQSEFNWVMGKFENK